MEYTLRQRRLAEAIRNRKITCVLITHLPNIRYLCGFSGSSGTLLLAAGKRGYSLTFFTDGRYTQQAADEVQGARVVIAGKPALMAAAERATKNRADVLGFEAERLPYASFQQLRAIVRGQLGLKPTSGLVEQLRITKDAEEIARIRAAVQLGSDLFPAAVSAIRPGVAETEVAAELELNARRAGADGMSFETIVAAGTRSALPHGRASRQAIPERGFIILDYGVILAGYCSDMTRTVHVGPVSPAHRRMYQAVHEAQIAGIQAVRPGVETGEVDRVGREILKSAGYDAYFTHSTGHGVGLEIHEQPRLAKGQKQKLEPGMVVTIEPGIYVPGDGGVRIEDMVLVTESGRQVLTPTSKELITV
ncbi:MAG TPA: Xaa-Pro peptidase family protein [Terriglobales bacterium]|nr:Xaa-Pro peptidase family protein [Terriglobales bacterium]